MFCCGLRSYLGVRRCDVNVLKLCSRVDSGGFYVRVVYVFFGLGLYLGKKLRRFL